MTDQQQALVEDGFVTVPEACRWLKIGRSKIYSLMSDEVGVLAYVKIGRCRRIAVRSLRELAAAGLHERRVKT